MVDSANPYFGRGSQPALADWIGVLLGSVAGFTSFVAHAGGPPAAIFLLSRPNRKTQYQATTVLVFWVLNIVKFFCYSWLGMMSLNSGFAAILLAPFALVGAYLGVYAHRLIPKKLFFRLAFVLLSLTGIKLIYDGLSGLTQAGT